jgi:hypothetical protein
MSDPTPSPFAQSTDKDAFLTHILALLEEDSHPGKESLNPSNSDEDSNGFTNLALQQRVESAILALSKRCKLAESTNATSTSTSTLSATSNNIALVNAPSPLPTPTETPPIPGSSTPNPSICSTCSHPLSNSNVISPRDNLHRSDSGMTAEKELELLKAQVSDIARVCKAVAAGDLTQKIIVPVEGHIMVELKGACEWEGVNIWGVCS